MSAITFREAYCERFQVDADDFAESVLWRCHHRRSLPLGKLIWRINPEFYDMDFELIRTLAECTTLEDFRTEVSDFRYHHHNFGFGRKLLHVRLSGQRLVDLAAKLFD